MGLIFPSFEYQKTSCGGGLVFLSFKLFLRSYSATKPPLLVDKDDKERDLVDQMTHLGEV